MTTFYDKAMTIINTECDRLDAECNAIDSDPAKKKESAEKYSLLKCRWGAITSSTAPFYNSHRLFADNSEAHYMVPHIWADLCADEAMYSTFNEYYDTADEDLRKDLALLFGYHAYAYRSIREKASKLGGADGREEIRLCEYLSGYGFALDSIRKAWNDTRGIDIKWRSPYSALLIESAMIAVVRSLQADCRDRLAKISVDAKNEKKALAVENGMYGLCLNAGMLAYAKDREQALRTKLSRMPRFIGRFPKLAEAFEGADDEEKLRLTAAFYGIVWMADQYLIPCRRELALAKESGDVRAEFELQIKVGTVTAVTEKWIELADIFGFAGLTEA